MWITVKNTKGELSSKENWRIRKEQYIIRVGLRGKFIKIAFVGELSVLNLTFQQQTHGLLACWQMF